MADTDSETGLAEAAADDITDDDWAAAMQEQVVSEAAVPEVAHAQPASFQNFDSSSSPSPTSMNDFDLILDIPVQLTVELGRTKISIRNLLQLAHGSVVELDALAGEPMDVLINGTLIAQGEVVVVNDKFGIRLTDIITPSERVRKLRN